MSQPADDVAPRPVESPSIDQPSVSARKAGISRTLIGHSADEAHPLVPVQLIDSGVYGSVLFGSTGCGKSTVWSIGTCLLDVRRGVHLVQVFDTCGSPGECPAVSETGGGWLDVLTGSFGIIETVRNMDGSPFLNMFRFKDAGRRAGISEGMLNAWLLGLYSLRLAKIVSISAVATLLGALALKFAPMMARWIQALVLVAALATLIGLAWPQIAASITETVSSLRWILYQQHWRRRTLRFLVRLRRVPMMQYPRIVEWRTGCAFA
jgi:hypothetical protein